jgi:phospholipase C
LKQASRLCGLAVLLGLAACQGIVAGAPQFPLPTPNPNATLQNSVNHIIFMMQENRSFDAYFGKLNEMDGRAVCGTHYQVSDDQSFVEGLHFH